ncbi:hypothetical protein MKW92_040155 [Papaver armeniacum]|nr:hypothetical protein MKW92_040155 [Papaver armeniacum]
MASYHMRSISFPHRSNPSALKVEEELNNLKFTWETLSSSTISCMKSKTIQLGLVGLIDLYNCVDDLINLPLTQQSLLNHRHEKLVEEVIDESVRLLDVCVVAREFLLLMKEGGQDLQSALRRKSGGESSIEANVKAYIRLRKVVKKDVNKCLDGALKRVMVNDKFISSPLFDQDQHLSVVVGLLREVSLISVSIFRSLFLFISAQHSKPSYSRWSLVSKMMHKGKIVCSDIQEDGNEVSSADLSVQAICEQVSSKDGEVQRRVMQMAQKRLKGLEISMEAIEEGVAFMYQRLIKTRVTLLNIFTH